MTSKIFNPLIFKYLSLFILLGCSFFATAQTEFHTQTSTTKKALRAFENGIIFDNRNDVEKAAEAFSDATEEDSIFVDAFFELANVQAKLKNFTAAKTNFEKVLALAPDFHPNILLSLAMAEWELDKFGEAATHADAFLAKNPPSEKMKRLAKRLSENARFSENAVKNPVPFSPKSLGIGVNSPESEYLPSLTADGETLIFTRLDGGFDENFYVSEKNDSLGGSGAKSSDWSLAKPVVEVNTNENEGAEAISADGTWLVFTACNRRNDNSQGSCDLYWSQQKKTGWTKPQPFSATINSRDWDAQPCISADGKTLIFSSERLGGVGGRDFWFSERTAGKWSPPKNLGDKVNTIYDEQCPFLHPDGQTLYFTSNGHPGLGDNDLYVSRRQPDGSWGRPENLGFPINTKSQEGTLVVSLDGRTAYFSSTKTGGTGKNDLYSFDLPEAVRPKPVTYVKAKVRDAVTRQSIVAQVEFVDLSNGEVFAEASTKSDGTFLTCLPLGKNYALNVSKKKYLFATENFSLAGNADFSKPFLLEILLQPIENQTATNPGESLEKTPTVGRPVVLNNVFFDSGKSELLRESAIELNRLAELMLENPSLKFQINGHTDSDGDEILNQKLSEARAKSVFDFLVSKNVPAERLSFRGFGETMPIDSNDSEAGKARNRRTEFEVMR